MFLPILDFMQEKVYEKWVLIVWDYYGVSGDKMRFRMRL